MVVSSRSRQDTRGWQCKRQTPCLNTEPSLKPFYVSFLQSPLRESPVCLATYRILEDEALDAGVRLYNGTFSLFLSIPSQLGASSADRIPFLLVVWLLDCMGKISESAFTSGAELSKSTLPFHFAILLGQY